MPSGEIVILYGFVPVAMVAGDRAVRAPVEVLREYIVIVLPP